MNKETEETTLQRDGEKPISFSGVLIAEESSDPDKLQDRWTEFKLYRTSGGKFVAQCVGKSVMPNEGDLSKCLVVEDISDADEMFKHRGKETWLTRRMRNAVREVYPKYCTASERVA